MSREQRPNVLWIGVDEIHLQTLGFCGAPDCKTPNLDELASQSLIFDRAFTPMAVCGPARSSMLTGRLPSEGSVICNNDMGWTTPYRAAAGKQTMGNWGTDLNEAGYRCVHVGKWHVTPDRDDKPSDYGFEGPDWPCFGWSWNEPDFHTYRQGLGLTPRAELEDGLPARHPIGSPFSPISARVKGPVEGSVPGWVAHHTIENMKRVAGDARDGRAPFFLRCEFWGPHIPCWVTEPYYSMYDPESLHLIESFGKLGRNKPAVHANFQGGWGIGTYPEAQQRLFLSKYLAYITCLDAQIGRILAVLDELGLRDQTMVVFTADHGEMFGAHGLYDKGPFMYDDIYRVPLTVRWPGVASPGRTNALAYNMDVGGTMWGLAGKPVPDGASARSLLPILTGRRPDVGREMIICEFWRQWDFYPQAMVHDGTRKFVFNFGGPDEFYDLDADPFEMDNRIDDPQARPRVNQMRAFLHTWLKEVKSPMLEGFERTLAAKLLLPAERAAPPQKPLDWPGEWTPASYTPM